MNRSKKREAREPGSDISRRCLLPAALSAALLATGCGGGAKPVIVNPSGTLSTMPAAPAATPVNTYTGTESIGLWSLTLDDSKSTYSYTAPAAAAVMGSFQSSNGFLNLGQANGVSLGYALEVPGRMALLRPGDSTAPLIVAVPQSVCYTLPYRLRFAYIAMTAAPGIGVVVTAYGDVLLNTDASGTDWQFQDLEGTAPSGPGEFTAQCSVANGQAALAITGSSIFNQFNNPDPISTTDLATNLQIGPSGIFVELQTSIDSSNSFSPKHYAAAVGIVEPVAPLSAADVAAGKYLGFLAQAERLNSDSTITTPVQPQVTAPVSFGPATDGMTMIGGVFAGDDVTQAPGNDITINLGTQDAVVNGLYTSAQVTRPDPAQNCATAIANGGFVGTPGLSPQGYPTCTFSATATVGNPEGKYAIFLTAQDPTQGNAIDQTESAALQIYLYQQ